MNAPPIFRKPHHKLLLAFPQGLPCLCVCVQGNSEGLVENREGNEVWQLTQATLSTVRDVKYPK